MGAGLLCCLVRRPQQRRGGEGEPSEGFIGGGTQWSGRSTSGAQRKTSTATERRWMMRGMNRVFDGPASPGATAHVGEEEEGGSRAGEREISREHQAAAAAIQACFRRHLARRALRALRSLVKVQAFARGAYVRNQADVAIRFMKVLVRLQVRVRARQLLQRSS